MKTDISAIPSNKRVTLRDLALELGLSDRAVSQALSPRESNVKLNPKTAQRIQELAAKRNYLRDSRARSMRYGRSFNIGYFEAKREATGWSLPGAMAGVCDAASARDYHVLLIRLPSEMASNPGAVPIIFRESNLDALIVCHAGGLSEELEKIIDISGFPVVYLNEKKSHNAVYVDDVRGSEDLTRYLISLGNQNIVYYSLTPAKLAHYSIADRIQGYRKAMSDAGLKPEVAEIPDYDLLAWMDAHKDVEAIVCYNDHRMLDVIRLLPAGFRIPANLALSGFGDDIAKGIKATTMRLPAYEMGKAAVGMALEMMDKKQKNIPSQVFPLELVVRDTTRNRLSEKIGRAPTPRSVGGGNFNNTPPAIVPGS